jgi:acyl-CoA thioester hydrolase
VTGVYEYEVEVPPSVIDANGHVNNVEFVRWMQEAAMRHATEMGCTAATQAAGATWVVRSHHIEYLHPALAGDRLRVRTWVANFRRAFSLRRYKFIRDRDSNVLARGETDWVFVDRQSGRPRTIPSPIQSMFELLQNDPGT